MNTLKKILIVDDSKLVLSLHLNILKKLGYECFSAENGILALESCIMTQFDLIVTDVNMPKMDGYEFTKRLRENINYKNVPVIIISTEQEAFDKIKGYIAGADIFIVKPVNPEELALHVKMLLGA